MKATASENTPEAASMSLKLAVEWDRIDMVQQVLASGAKVKRDVEESGTPGTQGMSGRRESSKEGAAPLSGVDRRGALQLAIEKKKLNIVKVLLQYTPGQRKVNNNSSLLHLSALSATMLSQVDLLSLYRTDERIFQVGAAYFHDLCASTGVHSESACRH